MPRKTTKRVTSKAEYKLVQEPVNMCQLAWALLNEWLELNLDNKKDDAEELCKIIFFIVQQEVQNALRCSKQ